MKELIGIITGITALFAIVAKFIEKFRWFRHMIVPKNTAHFFHRGKMFKIKPGYNSLGRLESNHITISDPKNSVGRSHAMIDYRMDGAIVLNDLDSKNGTYINELRVEKSTVLKDGDVVHFGLWKCIFLQRKE